MLIGNDDSGASLLFRANNRFVSEELLRRMQARRCGETPIRRRECTATLGKSGASPAPAATDAAIHWFAVCSICRKAP
jgi:hypothetical protein